ncbi:hypothetical protein EDD11_007959, partial [Mortierella claussenii]
MGLGPSTILKVSLWLQVGTLIVLTSLLADANAWIGAALTAFGLCFVTIGLGAAHKKSLGYLYCYATLLTAWTCLAAVHVITLFNVLAIPEGLVDPVLVVGQRIYDHDLPRLRNSKNNNNTGNNNNNSDSTNSSDIDMGTATNPNSTITDAAESLKIGILSLYGVQAFSWCVSLICLVCLRIAVVDPTLGFEIQSPKRKAAAAAAAAAMAREGIHTLERAERGPNSSKRASRLSQRLFGLGQPAVVAPMHHHHRHHRGYQREDPIAENQEKEMQHVRSFGQHEKDQYYQQHYQEEQRPEDLCHPMNCTQDEMAEDVESNVIYFPRGRRISQVVVTFRDDEHELDHDDEQLATRTSNIYEARNVFVPNSPFGLGELLMDKQEESLSDIIFKAVEPAVTAAQMDSVKAVMTRDKGDISIVTTDSAGMVVDTDSTTVSPTALSTTTTLEDAASYGKDLELINNPGVMSHIELLAHLQRERQKIQGFWESESLQEQEQGPMKGHEKDYVHDDEGDEEERLDYAAGKPSGPCPVLTRRTSSLPDPATPIKERLFRAGETMSGSNKKDRDSSDSDDEMEPDEQDCHAYYRSHPSMQPNSMDALPYSSNNYSFLKTTPTHPTKPTLVIPTIVLHPDEEDDEPARVLTEMDIEYLSTMPPVPMKQLPQPWEEAEQDEEDEEGYYDEMENDGYDFDYHHQYHQQDDEYDDEGEEEIQEEYYQAEDEDDGRRPSHHSQSHGQHQQQQHQYYHRQHHHQELQQPHRAVEGEFDPYALDVPINLEIDLQGLEQ